MREKQSPSRKRRAGEEGYILLAVLFMVVLVLITLSVAAPKVAADIERDREVELQHRAKQYVRAIKLYYKKFGAYPPNMDALEKTTNIRFLRRRYKDPITGKDEWHLIHFGENKTPSLGFFGQPLGGAGGTTALAGTGPGGVGTNVGGSNNGSIFGNNGGNGGSIFGNSPSNGGLSGGSNGGAIGGINSSGANGTASDPNSTNGSSTGSSFMSGTSSNNQTFGGGGIIGVESTSPKASILEYKKKKHFNEWEFFYDPNADRIQISGNTGTIGQPAGGSGSVNSSGFGFGSPQQGGGQVGQQNPQQPQQTPQQQQWLSETYAEKPILGDGLFC